MTRALAPRLAVVSLMLAMTNDAIGGYFDNATELARACKLVGGGAQKPQEADGEYVVRVGGEVACLGYINGFWHGYINGVQDAKTTRSICFPKGISPHQMAAVFVQWIEKNPQQWHLGPFGTMSSALEEAFPCPRG